MDIDSFLIHLIFIDEYKGYKKDAVHFPKKVQHPLLQKHLIEIRAVWLAVFAEYALQRFQILFRHVTHLRRSLLQHDDANRLRIFHGACHDVFILTFVRQDPRSYGKTIGIPKQILQCRSVVYQDISREPHPVDHFFCKVIGVAALQIHDIRISRQIIQTHRLASNTRMIRRHQHIYF